MTSSPRIIVASQPKTGNVWLRNLLCNVYGLVDLNERFGDEIPLDADDFVEFAASRSLPDGYVLQQHFYPTERLLAFSAERDCRLVTLLRNPYETFVSFFHYVNRLPGRFEGRPAQVLVGKAIDHPDVLAFLAGRYRVHLQISEDWLKSGASFILRYEELLANPVRELSALTEWVAPAPREAIARAVDACSAERVKAQGGWKSQHIRAARTRTWDSHLTPAHYRVFREEYARLISDLGYEVN